MKEFKDMWKEACWKGYKQVGTKKKGNKVVPNCVPEEYDVLSLDEKAKEFHLFTNKRDAEKKAKEIGGKVVTGTGKSTGYFAAMKEDAPANAVGDGSGVALPPSVEPGVNVKKKKNTVLGLLKREDYNRVEVENVINKITTNQEIEDNQIKPILNNIAKKKEKGTYTEEFGLAAMRYVVDQQTKLPEEQKDKIATSLLTKYE